MRLTLRTLLAYLDGILEPKDSEDLGKKIEESEYAATLVHRIRDVMRRLRLGAPSVSDRGPGLDSNTVAEYLDNTLANDRVTDFEKVCLDSDIHLAEVASCHQILTLVLGEPVEVDPETRQRMYRLKESSGPVKPPQTPPVIPAPDGPRAAHGPTLDLEPGDGQPPVRRPRIKPTVPEYLREPRRRPSWLAAAAMVVAAACVVVMVLWSIGQLEPHTPIGDILVSWGWQTDAGKAGAGLEEKHDKTDVAKVDPSPTGKTSQGEPAQPPHGEKSTESPKSPAADTATAPPVKSGVQAPQLPILPELPKPASASGPPEVGKKTTPIKPPEAVANPAPNAPGGPVGPELLPGIGKRPVETPETKNPGPDTKIAAPETKPPIASRPKPETKTAPEPLPRGLPEPMGRLLSNDQLLLCQDATGGWGRLAADQMLMPQGLLVLPTYRAKVGLTAGIILEILGGSRLDLLGSSSPKGPPGIRVSYGRVVLKPLAQSEGRLRVAFGDQLGTIEFVDPNSVVALDVRRLRRPGTNPENGPSLVTADLYVTTGNILWEPLVDGKVGQRLQLAPPQRVSFDAQVTSAPLDVKKAPDWITAEPIGALDRRASTAIAQMLPSDRPVRMGLAELMTTPPLKDQKEVKWLLLRCLGYVGQFRDMAMVLNDSGHHLDWPDYLDELRRAVDRDADTAAAVRQALEQQYPQQAAALYRMLWGYSNEDLKAGEDARLVKGLEDDLLAVRRLSYWNLRDITGAGLHYRPEDKRERRAASIRYWEQRRKNTEIRLKGNQDQGAAGNEEQPAQPAPRPVR